MVGRISLPYNELSQAIAFYLKMKHGDSVDIMTGDAIELLIKEKIIVSRNDFVEAFIKLLGMSFQDAVRKANELWNSWLKRVAYLKVKRKEDEVILTPVGVKVVAIRVPLDVYEELEEYARSHNKTVSEVVRELITNLVRKA